MTQSNLAFTDGHEIPKGYKKTEVGIIPNDWNVESLQNLCRSSITYGIVQCGPHIPNGIPYIRVSDMNSSELNVDEMLRTSPEIASSFGRSKVEEGDIVYALRGKLGEVKMVGTGVSGANLTQGTARIAPKNNIDNRYLLWTLRSPEALKQAVKEAKGSTFVEITLGNLKGIGVPLPSSREEQQKIATALSDTDALISELEKLIEKKQAIKTATMQQLLTGKTRLPEFALREDGTPKAYKDSELGQIPEDWEIKQLGEFVEITSGESPSKFDFINNGIPYFKVEQLNNGDFYAESTPYYVKLGKTISAGSLVFPKRGASILSNKIRILKVDACMDTNLMALTCDPELNPNYLLYALTYSGLDKVADTTSIPQINNKHVLPYKIFYPSLIEQVRISNILVNLENDIELSKQKVEKLRKIKLGMMQELLTGKTRLV
jgi:type I restriction enzyme, S subunit